MSNNNGNNTTTGFWSGNGSENDIDILKLVSPKFAIRGAVGNLGYGSLIQNLEDDMIRWAGEAYQKIILNTKAATIYSPVDQIAYTKNNRVKLCDGFKALQCLKLNGSIIPFLYNKQRCTQNCANTCGTGSCGCCVQSGVTTNCHAFYLDGCWVKFSPAVADGWEVRIAAWAIPLDKEGYMMVIEDTLTAIQEYLAWKICFRQGDNRAAACEKNWYYNCREARAKLNKKTDAELREIAKWWQPQGFFRGDGNRRNISNRVNF